MARTFSDDEPYENYESNDDDDFLDKLLETKRMKLDTKASPDQESDLDADQESLTEKEQAEGFEVEEAEEKPSYQIFKNKELVARKFKSEQVLFEGGQAAKGSVHMPMTSILKYEGEKIKKNNWFSETKFNE